MSVSTRQKWSKCKSSPSAMHRIMLHPKPSDCSKARKHGMGAAGTPNVYFVVCELSECSK